LETKATSQIQRVFIKMMNKMPIPWICNIINFPMLKQPKELDWIVNLQEEVTWHQWTIRRFHNSLIINLQMKITTIVSHLTLFTLWWIWTQIILTQHKVTILMEWITII